MDILERGPKDQAHPRTNCPAGCCLRRESKWQAAMFPRPLSTHVVVPAARHLFGVEGQAGNCSTLMMITCGASLEDCDRCVARGFGPQMAIAVCPGTTRRRLQSNALEGTRRQSRVNPR
jgi:hypothetical protein